MALPGRGVAGLVHTGGLDAGLVERHQLVEAAGVVADQCGVELLGAVEGVVVAARSGIRGACRPAWMNSACGPQSSAVSPSLTGQSGRTVSAPYSALKAALMPGTLG